MNWPEEDFMRVFGALYPPLVRFLSSLSGSNTMAQDLAQETFLRLYRTPRRRIPEAAVRFWVFRTARNLALNEIRSLARRARLRALFSPLVPARAESGEEAILRRQEGEEGMAILEGLPEAQRTALILREAEEMSYAEIAEVLRVSVGKVKTDIHRGRAALRQRRRAGASRGDVPAARAGAGREDGSEHEM